MKAFFRSIALSLSMTLCLCFIAEAQFVEDALRLGAPGLSVGARSLGLGTAYTGVADDFSAAYWNPAGLGQIRLNEVSFGLSNLSFGNKSTLFNSFRDTNTFFGNNTSTTNSSTNLNSAGLVYAVPTERGSLVFALGYGRQSDFTAGSSFNGFNPRNSIVQSWAANGALPPPDSTIAEQLALAVVDTLTGRFYSPIGDSLTQSGRVFEGGGINFFTVAGSIEAAQNVYLGLTLNFISGSYSYRRNYFETDANNIYQGRFPYDLSQISVTENLETDISGFNAKLGFLYAPTPNSRVGLTVKTPSWVTARETFTSSAASDFYTGLPNHLAVDFPVAKNEYDVKTPFSFSGGFSVTENIVTLVGDLEYTDWSQLEFSSSGTFSSAFNDYLLGLNSTIKDTLQATVNLRGGIEVALPKTDISLRAGFAYLPSAYRFESSSNAQKYITAGIGFLLDNSIALDLGYAHGFWDVSHVVYKGQNQNRNSFSTETSEQIRTNTLIATFAYRF